MEFNNIVILLKKGLEKSDKIVEDIRNIFLDKKLKIISFDEVIKEYFKDLDLVITLGGDGTFVKAAHFVQDSYILGINLNPNSSEGALTSLDINEVEKLKQLKEGKFDIIERQRADVILNKKLLDEKAVNEVYLGSSSQFHSSRYKIFFKDKNEEQRSSGVIVSTGTGSNAWFLSAGGEAFNFEEKKLKFLVREPYRGKRLFIPKLVNGEILDGEKLTIESTRDFGGVLAINDSIYPFNRGDIAEIKLSDKPLKVIILN